MEVVVDLTSESGSVVIGELHLSAKESSLELVDLTSEVVADGLGIYQPKVVDMVPKLLFREEPVERLRMEESYDFSSHYPASTDHTPPPETPVEPVDEQKPNASVSKDRIGFWKRLLRVFACGTHP